MQHQQDVRRPGRRSDIFSALAGWKSAARALSIVGLVVLAAGTTACDDGGAGGGDIPVFIVGTQPNPPAGHAPVDISFEVDFPRGEFVDEDFDVRWEFGDGAALEDQVTPTHTYVSEGEYEVVVTVRNRETGAEGRAAETVRVLPSAELAVTGVSARPEQVLAGEEIQALFTLRSEGVEVEYPFSAITFLTENGSADPGDTDEFSILTTERLDGMPADGEDGSILDRNLDLRVPESVPSGDYYVGVLIDSEQQIGELDEANNIFLTERTIRVSNPSTDGPDLVPVDVNVSPRRTRILNSVTLSFTVENRGPATALAFDYAVYMSPDDIFDEGIDTFLLEGTVDGVGQSSSTDVTDVLVPINPAITDPGQYHFIVVLDPSGEVTELSETNNVAPAQSPVTVTDEPILDADIVVTDFRVTPDSTFLGGSFDAEIDLVNQGQQATGSFVCALYLSEDQVLDTDGPEMDTALSSINVFELPGEAEETFSTIVVVPSSFVAGEYYAFALCDSSGVVVEFDEANNVQRYQDMVRIALNAEVDLTASNVTIDPTSPVQDGSAVTVGFEACNAGSTGASPVLMRVLQSQDGQPDAQDLVAFEGTLPGIGPGECAPVEAEIEARCVDWTETYELLVQLDVRDLLDETSEMNNVASLSGGLTVEGEFCRCDDDVAEPNDLPSVPFPLVIGSNPGFSLCSGDADWFSVALQAGDSVEVTMTHDPAFGELDITLYDPGRGVLEQTGDESDGTDTVDTWLVPSAGDYLVQVSPASPGEINVFDLDVTIASPKSGVSDLAAVDLEPSTLTPELNTAFDLALALVNLGDQAVSTDVRVQIFLTQDTTVDPATDTLLDDFIVEGGIGGETRMELTRAVTIPGETTSGFWRIGAIADPLDDVVEDDETNNASASNALRIDTTCFDVLEPNDSLDAAVEITPSEVSPPPAPLFEGLVVCKSNPDFYRIAATNGSALSIEVEAGPDAGDFDIVLRDEAGQAIASSRTSNDVESIDVPVIIGDQDLFLEVFELQSVFNRDKSTYDLTVSMVDADPGLVCNAELEPNDSFATAVSLIDAAATPNEIATCPETDKDTYRINLAAGTRIEVTLDTQSTKLRATLYDTSELPVPGQTIFNADTDRIDYTAPVGGTYYVQVFPGAGAEREETYGLTLTGVEGVDLAPVGFEIAPSALAAGEAVQYTLQVSNPGAVASGAYDVDILLSDDSLITPSDAVIGSIVGADPIDAQGLATVSGKVDIPPSTTGGRYWVGALVDPADAIAELDEFNNDASAPIDVTTPCSADAFEAPTDNDSAGRATDLASNAPLMASICPGDADWYVLSTTAGQMVTFTATFTHASGDLDIRVYDDSLTKIGESRSLTDNEEVTVTSAGGGDVFVEVRGFTASDENDYSLDFSTP